MADETSLLQNYIQAGETNISNLLLHHYKEIGMTTSQLVLYLEFKSYQDRGIVNPDIRLLAKHLGTDEKQVFNQLHQMMTNHLVEQQIRQLSDGKEDVFFDFSALVNKLINLQEQTANNQQVEQTANKREATFAMLESEFGRPLSSMELQIVNDWFDKDQYTGAMIKLALRQAVMNSALNLQYMERILQNWQRQGLRTERDITEHERKFEERRSDQESNRDHGRQLPKGPKIPIYKLGE